MTYMQIPVKCDVCKSPVQYGNLCAPCLAARYYREGYTEGHKAGIEATIIWAVLGTLALGLATLGILIT